METKGKVDVLEVMQEAADALCTRENVAIGVRMNGARTAVAELIEAAELHCDARDIHTLVGLKAALSALRSSQGGREGDEGEGRG